MKKVWLAGIILLSFLISCGGQSQLEENDPLSSIENQENNQKINSEGKGFTLDSELPYEETMDEIVLPEKYKDCDYLVAVDDGWYYFVGYREDDCNVYIKISRDDPSNVVELSKVKISNCTIRFGWKGDLYVNVFYPSSDGPYTYELLKLSENSEPEVILSGESTGYSEMSFADPYLVVLSVSQEWENNLNVYNMETGEMTHVYDCVGVQDETDWSISGTIVNGMFWHGALPSAEGFCYMVSDMNQRTFDDGKTGQDIIYYYSFENGENQELFNHHYVADYVGGTKEVLLVSDFENVGHAEHLYVKNESGYDVYTLKEGDDTFGGFIGFGMLDKNRYVAYGGEGFLILNVGEKTYAEKTFSGISETDEELDYTGIVRGWDFQNGSFYFAVLENEKLQVYCIK